VPSGGSLAETSFRVIERRPRGIWVEAIPKTGRTHQIRVHLAEYGLPILGDDLYGPPDHSSIAPRLMLHAAQLIFRHPINRDEVRVKSPLPADFQECLDRLGTTERMD
jgi:23S rRNA-/tRNA-specific pseudouridylate synthase